MATILEDNYRAKIMHPTHAFLKCLILSTCLFMGVSSGAQILPPAISFDQQNDKVWLDSLKSIIRYDEKHPRASHVLRYFNNCALIGLYYEKLYRKKVISSNEVAVKFYKKIINYEGVFPDWVKEKYVDGEYQQEKGWYKPSAIQNTVSRKLAAMYFSGDGIKKDRKYSLALALEGSRGVDGFVEYYSAKYYKNPSGILNLFSNANSDSFGIEFNPFAIRSGFMTLTAEWKQFLQKITTAFHKRSKTNSALTLFIKGYAVTSNISQSRCRQRVEASERYLVEYCGISNDRIRVDCEVGTGVGEQYLDIFFQ